MKTDTRWDVNEGLLQDYRSDSLAIQGLLLAVGAIIYEKSTIVLIATAVLSLFMMWGILFPVVRARARVVDFYKYGSELPEELFETLSVDTYVRDRKERKRINHELFGGITNWRPTRKKLDIYAPVIISLVWIILVVFQLVG